MAVNKSKWRACQQPNVYEPDRLEENEWIGISRKINGVHGIFRDGQLITRQTTIITNVEHLLDECWMLSEALGANTSAPAILDGELIADIPNPKDEFEVYERTVELVNTHNIDKTQLHFRLFDYVPYTEYFCRVQRKTDTYRKRKQALINAYNALSSELEYTNLVDFLYEGNDHEQILHWLTEAKARGWEGIVINKDAPYERTRNYNVMKYKYVHTVDLPIVDFKVGKGKYARTLGTIIAAYKGNKIAVGAGMSYDIRDYIWANREFLKDRVVEVAYQSKTVNKKTGLESLQFPVYRGIREQGKEINEDE